MKIVKIISMVTALILPFSFFGCKKTESEKDKKYDVAIRVRCDKRVYEFPIGVDEIHDERYYDMSSHSVYVETYQLIDCSWAKGSWLTPTYYSPNVFYTDFLYTDPNGIQDHSVKVLKERGTYIYRIEADDGSDIWNGRVVRLILTVK